MVFLFRNGAIPPESPTPDSQIQFTNSQGKLRVCLVEDLDVSGNPEEINAQNIVGLTEFIQETSIPGENVTGTVNATIQDLIWVVRDQNFTAAVGVRYLVDNRNSSIEVQLPNNPPTGNQIEFLLLGTNPVIFRINGNKYIGTDFDIRSIFRLSLIQLVYSGSALGWIPTNPANQFFNRATIYNTLTYTPVALENYTWFNTSNTLAQINDNQLSAFGMMKSGPANTTVKIRLDFAVPTIINRLEIYNGQSNGPFNGANFWQLFTNGTATGQVAATATLATNTTAMQRFELIDNANLGNPLTSYSIIFAQNSGNTNISVLELDIFGYTT